MSDQNKESSQGLWEVIRSVFASFLGVQSGDQHERDFAKGKASHYIIIGLVFTVLFILALVGIVQIVMHFAGA